MGLAMYAQCTQVNLKYLFDILRKKSIMKLGIKLQWLVQILLLQLIKKSGVLPPLILCLS